MTTAIAAAAKPVILDGTATAARLMEKLSRKASELAREPGFRTPVLATILVGDDPASATYVRMKRDACGRVGLDSRAIVLPQHTSTAQLLAEIDALNADPDVHGILLQHPVPEQIDERACFDRIALRKDVDGVTSQGFGLMALGEPAFGSATPAGIMTLLEAYGIELTGRRAVVIGRSPILGRPMAQMLVNANATVTLCHSRTIALDSEVSRADVVVAAVGKPHFVQSGWIRPGAVVVDAGFHPGRVGDVEPSQLAARCSAYTPVPGGVGPMTIATLVAQTLQAAELAWQAGRRNANASR
ncbi:tetrahydrofolate dehydrogenase/cyclohydrolase catalytic domain-containing protein [Paraburkholderia sp. ZP32-5]|uniref:tetrahydrofolate dehydrogenase/cyclohydrolase catalytic domain-containing protein n=1 Tax=Paraburkholderia sp. ZP32-5 TaxID=2883245 RepID=UPI001F2BD058|nr:tetrahydrofolate dehydrogenase/cyclohydrolase catalytic domain-containing protein [Paraburkholderia sp. ZP32-5]